MAAVGALVVHDTVAVVLDVDPRRLAVDDALRASIHMWIGAGWRSVGGR